jgi:antitoxin (DNA-binding transcriptional repressor) of toxin-antitoxin stability system
MDLALAVKSMHFCTVNATLTQLRREAGKVLSAVLHGNKTVRLTQHGRAVAEIRPRPQPLSPAEFARLWRSRRPLGKDTADEVAAALKELDAAQ